MEKEVQIPFARSALNYDRDVASFVSGLECRDPSMTQQCFKEECDINTIIDRFGLNGELPADVRAPTYGDFEDVFDFHSAMNAIAVARESFETMPAHVRARFNNDPGEFVSFCSSEENRAEAEKLGLIVPRDGKAPMPAPEARPAPGGQAVPAGPLDNAAGPVST